MFWILLFFIVGAFWFFNSFVDGVLNLLGLNSDAWKVFLLLFILGGVVGFPLVGACIGITMAGSK